MSSPRRAPSLLESFNFAFDGIIHVLRTQRNMRIHFIVAVLVLVAALAAGVEKLELIALLLAIAFVLIAEMVNTAVEAAIDVATTSFDPMAKLAKDIAAGELESRRLVDLDAAPVLDLDRNGHRRRAVPVSSAWCL